jgi:hypothetical protein
MSVALASPLPWLCLAALACPVLARAAETSGQHDRHRPVKKSFLPLLGEEATKRGIELPLPFGGGLVFYHLDRDIQITTSAWG